MKVTIAQCETGETFAETANDPGVWINLGSTDGPLPEALSPRQAGWLEKYHRGGVEHRRIVQERTYDTSDTHD